MTARVRIAVTPGEPAGIGPDLVIAAALRRRSVEFVCVADPELLQQRARQLGVTLRLREHDATRDPRGCEPGELVVLPVPGAADTKPGELNTASAGYVLETLRLACAGCLDQTFAALVTGPVHKANIIDAGHRFSGHTELLAELAGGTPVMLLVAGSLRVALLTTHLALADVPAAVTAKRVDTVVRVLDRDLRHRFHVDQPRIAVCGLNPHAGEGGHLGDEEQRVIAPALDRLRTEGFTLLGPLPADTAFTPPQLARCDAVLAMYHDQGLPVLKHAGFGTAVNVTLGLPIVRTSVDHGTALELAGSGRADPGSLQAAMDLAVELTQH